MLARVEALNPVLGVFSDVVADRAGSDAVLIDQQRASGATLGTLAGIPVAVKDLIGTVSARCSGGLPFRAEKRPTRDAARSAACGAPRRASLV